MTRNHLGVFLVAIVQKITKEVQGHHDVVVETLENVQHGAHLFYYKLYFVKMQADSAELLAIKQQIQAYTHNSDGMVWLKSTVPIYLVHPQLFSRSNSTREELGVFLQSTSIHILKQPLPTGNNVSEVKQLLDFSMSCNLFKRFEEKSFTLNASEHSRLFKSITKSKTGESFNQKVFRQIIEMPEWKDWDSKPSHSNETDSDRNHNYRFLSYLIFGAEDRHDRVRLWMYHTLYTLSQFAESKCPFFSKTNTTSHEDQMNLFIQQIEQQIKKFQSSANVTRKMVTSVGTQTSQEVSVWLKNLADAQLYRTYAGGKVEIILVAATFGFNLLNLHKRIVANGKDSRVISFTIESSSDSKWSPSKALLRWLPEFRCKEQDALVYEDSGSCLNLIVRKLDNFDPSVIPTPFQGRTAEDWFSTRNSKWLKVYNEDFFSLGKIREFLGRRKSPHENLLYAAKILDPLYGWVRGGGGLWSWSHKSYK